MKPNGVVKLRPGREKAVRNGHPWIFSGAIERTEGKPSGGDIVDVVNAQGEFLARGYYNRRSQITVRLLTWRDEEIDAAFLRARLAKALAWRQTLGFDGNAFRVAHAESDLLPGLVVDRYANYLVMQVLTLGMERWKREVADMLAELVACAGIYERSDVDVREKEGLTPAVGTLWGQEPPDAVEIEENSHRFLVDVKAGQKTGFYLDQRANRARIAAYSQGRAALNAFSYTGAHTVYALAAGASSAVNIDTSADALRVAREHLALNGFADRQVEDIVGDVFHVLRQFRDQRRQFDLIILDPPKFAYSQDQVLRATRGYKDINLLAMQLLRPEGILATFSCSGLVSPDLFQKVVFGASVDAGRDVQIVEKLSQAPDHPILLTFPEGEYLKGLICRVL